MGVIVLSILINPSNLVPEVLIGIKAIRKATILTEMVLAPPIEIIRGFGNINETFVMIQAMDIVILMAIVVMNITIINTGVVVMILDILNRTKCAVPAEEAKKSTSKVIIDR